MGEKGRVYFLPLASSEPEQEDGAEFGKHRELMEASRGAPAAAGHGMDSSAVRARVAVLKQCEMYILSDECPTQQARAFHSLKLPQAR